jgi:hypothetical protein
MTSAASCAERFDDPVAGAALAERAATDNGRPPRFGDRFMQTNGQAPWFSGSSCAHTTSASG